MPSTEWEGWLADHDDGVLLDVREDHEWELGTLPGATCISMGDIPAALDQLDRQAPILVVCRSGARSNQVAQFLILSGFAEVANMAGGMKALGMQD